MPRSDTASRFIRVLPADVYDALIDPEALVMWLPPGKMTGRFERFDARPGGFHRLVSSYPNAEGGKPLPILTLSRRASLISSTDCEWSKRSISSLMIPRSEEL
jgi:uncharacterized protein YndB with AHSA1/START domain